MRVLISNMLLRICLTYLLTSEMSSRVSVRGDPCNTETISAMIDGACYWITQTSQLTQTDGQTECRTSGGHLAEIINFDVIQQLYNLAAAHTVEQEYKWVGYYVDPSTMEYENFTLLDGRTQTYKPFPPLNSRTMYHRDYKCVALLNELFFPKLCNESRRAVCTNYRPVVITMEATTETTTKTTQQPTRSLATTATSTTAAPTTTTAAPTTTSTISARTTTTAATTASENCYCAYLCKNPLSLYNDTEKLNQRLLVLRKTLQLQKDSLSSAKRKKISAADDRPSAAKIGYFGAVVIGSAILIIVFFDVIKLCRCEGTRRINRRHSRRKLRLREC